MRFQISSIALARTVSTIVLLCGTAACFPVTSTDGVPDVPEASSPDSAVGDGCGDGAIGNDYHGSEAYKSGNSASVVGFNRANSPCTGTIGLSNPPVQRFSAYVHSGYGQSSSAMGDLNGDGLPDLAFVNQYSNSVQLMYNQGDGTFIKMSDIAVGLSFKSIAIADLDSDGALDVVGLRYGSNAVSVLYNLGKIKLGNGKFGAIVDYPIPTLSTELIIADIDGDALPDIVTSHQYQNAVFVMHNDGNRVFGAPVGHGVNKPTNMVATDLNGDGLTDIVAIQGAPYSGLLVLLNDGFTNLGPPVQYSLGTYYHRIAAGDMNADGWPDMVLASSSGVDVMFNQGDGYLAAAITYATGACGLTLADVDKDNQLDVVLPDVSVLRNQGNGLLAPGIKYASIGGCQIHAADLNQDGNTDLVVVRGTSSAPATPNMEVLFNLGDGTFAPHVGTIALSSPGYCSNIVGADFSGDGIPDLALRTGVLVNPGIGANVVEISYPGGIALDIQVMADFNLDGKLDLAGFSSGQRVVMLNQGSATFGAPTPINWTGTGLASAPVAADFNGDNLPDLAIAVETITSQIPYCSFPCPTPGGCCQWDSYSENTLHVLINQGNGTFTEGILAVNSGIYWGWPSVLAASDFNDDGVIDLAYGIMSTQTTQILINKGSANFTFGANYPVNNGFCLSALVAADVNADGYPDLSACGVRLNQGDGTFGAPIGTDKAAAWVDLSGDGVPERVGLTHLLTVKRNPGAAFGSEALYVTGGGGGQRPRYLAPADFNSDGKLDLAVMNCDSNGGSSSPTLSILLNQCLP